MKYYKIEAYQANGSESSRNPLSRFVSPTIHQVWYNTREAACEAIYSAMYDVIDGDYGCEMIDRDIRGSLYTCDKNGENAEPLNAADEPYTVDDAVTVELGGDDPTLKLVETTLPNWEGVAFAAVNSDGEEVGWYQFRDIQPQETYIDACREYIMREGYASEGNLSVHVVEYEHGGRVYECDENGNVEEPKLFRLANFAEKSGDDEYHVKEKSLDLYSDFIREKTPEDAAGEGVNYVSVDDNNRFFKFIEN